MDRETDGEELEACIENVPHDGVNETEYAIEAGDESNRTSPRWPLPWIGALPNHYVGPMVVLNDGGSLVPLFTAGDLLRGCKYYWHRSQA